MDIFFYKEVDKGVIVSIMVYIFLFFMKIIISYIIFFSVLCVDGLNNLMDIGVFLVILIGLKIFCKFCDLDYLYGYLCVE